MAIKETEESTSESRKVQNLKILMTSCVIHCHIFIIHVLTWSAQTLLLPGCLITSTGRHVITGKRLPAFHSAYLFGQITKLAVRPVVHCCVLFNTQSRQSIKAAHLLVMLNTQGSVQGQVKEMFAAAESQARTDRARYCSWLPGCSAGVLPLPQETSA